MNTKQIIKQVEKYKENHKMVFIEGVTVKGERIQRVGFIWNLTYTNLNVGIVKYLDTTAGGMSSIRLENIKTIRRQPGIRK